MTRTPLVGAGTALVTPFRRDGAVDERALRALVEWQIAEGIHFLVPCGSTGEAATLTTAEHRRVVELTVEVAAGRVPILAGAGSNDTRRAIALSQEMRAAGATHLLHVSPMYNKPPQRGMLAHFRAIADAVDLPVVIYNVPGRTASNIEPDTTLELARDERFVGIKEASGNLEQISRIIRERPSTFAVLSGDDGLTFAIMKAGGEGVISVTSNATPRLVAQLVNLMRAGKTDEARAVDQRLGEWTKTAFVESNPIPAKSALSMMGKLENVLRLPLVQLDSRHEGAVRAALRTAGALV